MTEIPKNGIPRPDEEDGLAADAFATVVDPDFVSGADAATPEEKRAREHPEGTGS